MREAGYAWTSSNANCEFIRVVKLRTAIALRRSTCRGLACSDRDFVASIGRHDQAVDHWRISGALRKFNVAAISHSYSSRYGYPVCGTRDVSPIEEANTKNICS
jgi:hypothetical protein